MAADFNNDGITDLLFACHKLESAHRNLSFLYEGTPEGFSPERRQLLPGLGPHFLAGVDVGHVSDRGDRYDYISEVFDAGGPVRFQTLGWEGETPFASAVEFQVRGAESIEALRQTAWKGPDGEGSVYTGRRFSLKGLETPTPLPAVQGRAGRPQRHRGPGAAFRVHRLPLNLRGSSGTGR